MAPSISPRAACARVTDSMSMGEPDRVATARWKRLSAIRWAAGVGGRPHGGGRLDEPRPLVTREVLAGREPRGSRLDDPAEVEGVGEGRAPAHRGRAGDDPGSGVT